MNNKRRKAINSAIKKLEEIPFRIARQISWDHFATEAKDIVEDALCEERDCFENMPESLQGSDAGQRSETAIQSLEAAFDYLSGDVTAQDAENAVSELESAVEA